MECSYCTDQYTWRVVYYDGSTLDECPMDGGPHRGFAEVDKSRIAGLEWIPRTDGLALFSLIVPPGATGELFRRHLIQVFSFDPVAPNRLPPIYGLGWAGSLGQAYLFRLPDGSIIVSSDKNAV